MHVRMVRLTGSPTGVEERPAIFEREAMPTLREQPGFAGVVLVADPEAGAGGVVTYWESEAAMTASAAALAANRERLRAALPMELLSIEEYEVTLAERRQPPQPGTCVRLTRVQGSSAGAADAALTRLSEEGLSLASTLPGFRALIAGVDRGSGRLFIASSWNTPADREASEAATADLRRQLGEAAQATSVEVENYQVVFAEMPATAKAPR